MDIIRFAFWTLVVWMLITAAGVLSYVYVGQRCADGLRCLGVTP